MDLSNHLKHLQTLAELLITKKNEIKFNKIAVTAKISKRKVNTKLKINGDFVMKKGCILLMLVVAVFSMFTVRINSQSSELKKSVFGNGGMVGVTNADGIKINIITGQFAIGKLISTMHGSTNYNVNQGFWVPEPSKGTGIDEPIISYNRDLMNYPNPVKSETTIEYNVPAGGDIIIKVYDLVGNEMTTIVNSYHPAGTYFIVWDTKNENGEQVVAGSYLYEMQVTTNNLAGATASNNYILRNVMIIAR